MKANLLSLVLLNVLVAYPVQGARPTKVLPRLNLCPSSILFAGNHKAPVDVTTEHLWALRNERAIISPLQFFEELLQTPEVTILNEKGDDSATIRESIRLRGLKENATWKARMVPTGIYFVIIAARFYYTFHVTSYDVVVTRYRTAEAMRSRNEHGGIRVFGAYRDVYDTHEMHSLMIGLHLAVESPWDRGSSDVGLLYLLLQKVFYARESQASLLDPDDMDSYESAADQWRRF